MLKKLTIQNYALIEGLDIDFPNGLIIITGETGAGKSILLGAISLLQGGKADVSVLKDVTKNCVVEGIFSFEDRELILRRVISPQGRSRFFIDDEPVTGAALAERAERCLDIHAQHKHLLLTQKDFQLNVLDYFSATGSLLAKYRQEYKRLLSLRAELAQIDKVMAADEAEREYREFQLSRLKEAALQEGELEELEAEQARLANAEEIKGSLQKALYLLESDEFSLLHNLKEAASLIEKSSAFIPSLAPLAARMESCRIECKDILDEAGSVSDTVSVAPERLQQVDDRIAQIHSLLKRYNADTVSALIEIRDSLSEKLKTAENGQQRREAVAKEVTQAEKSLAELLEKLHSERVKGAPKLAAILQKSIRSLEMPAAHFSVVVDRAQAPTPEGGDAVRFLFSANGADKMVELQKVASGGELSRIMLCIKKLMAEYTGMPTLFFDEIDVGVSGSIADKMGQLLSQMGERMQLFAITHLPQVASKGNTHLLVYKEITSTGEAHTRIKFITGEERVKEIARLLSGEHLTREAVANAKVLLAQK